MNSMILMRAMIVVIPLTLSTVVVQTLRGNSAFGFDMSKLGGVSVTTDDGETRRMSVFDFMNDPEKLLQTEPQEAVLGGVREIPAAWGYVKDGKANELLFLPDDLNVTRTIIFSHEVPFSAFLQEGEAPPAPNLQSLYVQARAANFLARYCSDALQGFATKCAFLDLDIKEKENNYYRITGRFAYAPNFDLGMYEEKDGYEALTLKVDLPKRGAKEWPAQNSQAERRKVFQLALDACAEVRKTYSNCVVERIYVNMYQIKPKAKKDQRGKKVKTITLAKSQKFATKVKRFGEPGGFGKKAGFGQADKSNTKKNAKPKAKVFPYKESLSASAILAVYTLDTRSEAKTVDELGERIENLSAAH